MVKQHTVGTDGPESSACRTVCTAISLASSFRGACGVFCEEIMSGQKTLKPNKYSFLPQWNKPELSKGRRETLELTSVLGGNQRQDVKLQCSQVAMIVWDSGDAEVLGPPMLYSYPRRPWHPCTCEACCQAGRFLRHQLHCRCREGAYALGQQVHTTM